MRKINKIDKFYQKRETLKRVNQWLGNGSPLYTTKVKDEGKATTIKISLCDVFQDIDREDFVDICYRLEREFENSDVRKKFAVEVVKDLKEELEERKEEIRKDFELGGKKEDV